MKSKLYSYLILFLMFACVVSCKEDDDVAPQAAATFTVDKQTAKVGEDIQFTNTSQNATAFKWSFGDGTTSKDLSPKKSYESSGTFVVSLLSSGAGGATISSLTITVVPNPSFTVEGDDNLVALTPIKFTNASKGATSYLWSFGNEAASTSTDPSPTFTYLKAGSYKVTLKAISASGESTFEKQITVKAATPDVYFIENGSELMKKLSLDGSGTVSNFLDLAGKIGVGLAYDDVHGKIYFSDFNEADAGKIWRVNLDGTELEAVVSDLVDPYGIALDVASGKVYWCDGADANGIGHISRANLDGSGKEDVVSVDGAGFRAIALDLKNDKMYFYEVENEDLYIANLDGSNATPIISGVYGYAILVDSEHDKIYFDEQNDELLKRANLDGSGIETVDDNGTRIYGMSIDSETDKLYWSGRDSGTIFEADLDGSNKITLKSGLASPRGMFLRK
ncbi:PKD domain-containing protein [Chryseolinea lacunae]|uniref:PKD domain-containing protein n=1 Tax=Chryseolinea lacunae TaxID=2801331 RepID=A0ABS1L175_9BACT|nr:PKD domain-containing protein [Chryseolinea lacunae]MBL0745277.1 PKD domain-containing protein [Chryseolinea lacunae]